MVILSQFGLNPAAAAGRTMKIVALGDSLTAGYLLPAKAAFPAVLERELRAGGLEVEVINAGVSGDTSSNGLERLDWALGEGTDALIVELGANDMLRGLDPAVTHKAINEIITRAKARGIKVLLAGMVAAPGMGKDFEDRFNGIYARLAREHDVPLYPFFLAGVAGDAKVTQADGLHPTAAGVEIIVRGILPSVRALIASLPARS